MIKSGKIAICISGQTRDYNQNIEKYRDMLDILFSDFEYDIYGHTWDDCAEPVNADEFKRFLMTDQDEIWNFVKKDLFRLVPFRAEWIESQEYSAALENDTGFVQLCKRISNGAFGQFWSAYLCLNQIENIDEYSFIVRMRWDNYLTLDNEDIIAGFKKRLLDFKNKKNMDSDFCSTGGVLLMNEMLVDKTGVFFNDVFFILNTASAKKIINNSIDYAILDIYNKTSKRPTAHHLWYEYLVNICNCTLSNGLANVVGINSSYLPKENKKWRT